MSEQSQSASKRGGVRPGAGRPEGSVGPRRARLLRRRALIAAYSDALGGVDALSEPQKADIKKAAELTALAEDARALALQEGPGRVGMLSVLIRLESASARAVARLRLPPLDRAAPAGPTLAEYLAHRTTDEPEAGDTS